MIPDQATICEVGLRDGFQSEDSVAPTDFKIELIRALSAAGVPELQAASFVHPKWVPQMADAEAVWERLDHDGPTLFTGLVLNQRGLERAHAAGVAVVDLSISTHDDHSRANANMSLDQARREMLAMIEWCHAHGMVARAGLQCVFGCAHGAPTDLDRVVDLAREIAAAGAESVSLADSTGVANPVQVREVVSTVGEAVGSTPIVLHLHNTRGLGMANVAAALESGVSRFDASIGGMGGCPFIAGATGNIATEDVIYLLESMGVTTGIGLDAVANVTRRAEAFFGHRFPGTVHRLILDQGISVLD